MNYDVFTAELEAYQSLHNLLEQAKECKRLHERAQLPVPEPLKRLFAMNTNGDGKSGAAIPPPDRPPAPVEAESDWVWIDVKDAYATSLALALMRQAEGPMAPKEVVLGIQASRDDIPSGTIYNLGARLDGTVIKRSDEGWELLEPESAPIWQDNLLWGPATIFNKHEHAAMRRVAILHILGLYRAGQQTSQLIDMLRNCAWLKAPINKELVQDDVEFLSGQGKIKRRGNSKKWELTQEK